MYAPIIPLNEIKLQDLLTADTHSQQVFIKDDSPEGYHDLIPNRATFFGENGLYASVDDDGLTIIHSDSESNISFQDLIEVIEKSVGSCVILIEGFAGCGKSTLVQYILFQQLKTDRYDYSFYNYDLETQNDIIIYDSNRKRIKRSSIFEAIKKSFFEQFCEQIIINKNLFDDFSRLLEICENYQPFDTLYHNFFNTDTYDEIKKYVKTDLINKISIIKRNLKNQVDQITSSSCILALDYLFRLTMYKNNMLDSLYICYDNLDAIEDAEDLRAFDEKLISFTDTIDRFILLSYQKGFFINRRLPHFIIIATYRKITVAITSSSNNIYREVGLDRRAGSAHNKNIFHVDATSAYSYNKIVNKRTEFFGNFFVSLSETDSSEINKVMEKLFSWNNLNQSLSLMNDRYSCLWNKNYRTCSLIADKLYENCDFDFKSSVSFINKHRYYDGYFPKNKKQKQYSYCGGSAIILNNICKVFNSYGIWDDTLELTNLNLRSTSPQNISFSRLILTYIYNSNNVVSLEELYATFCKTNLFSYESLCTILAKMLARNTNGIWRRPIYYSSVFILEEDIDSIDIKLQNEKKSLEETGKAVNNYDFVLCSSGKTYVERLMQEFEFFSNRLSNTNHALYLYSDINSIKKIIDSVYLAVSQCCRNMIAFKNKYLSITNISTEEYLSLRIHPRTIHSHSPQLHTERTIFSHIAYLNDVRLYFVNENVTREFKDRKKFNEMFVNYIDKYLELYKNHISPISSKRDLVEQELSKIVKAIKTANSQINNNDASILFTSISL